VCCYALEVSLGALVGVWGFLRLGKGTSSKIASERNLGAPVVTGTGAWGDHPPTRGRVS